MHRRELDSLTTSPLKSKARWINRDRKVRSNEGAGVPVSDEELGDGSTRGLSQRCWKRISPVGWVKFVVSMGSDCIHGGEVSISVMQYKPYSVVRPTVTC